MRVRLDCELLGRLIKERGGVDAFLDQWHSLSPDAGERLNRATVYRWANGETVPKNGKLFLRLSGLLDVDPFALIRVPNADVVEAADEVLRIVQNSIAPPPWLQFVHAFFGRQLSWPPEDLASLYFGRPWHVQEFSHDPSIRASYYARILLRLVPVRPDRPQVVHFAYKHPFLFHARWLQYGLVRVDDTSAALHHISGHIDRLGTRAPNEPIGVETWFGPGPAVFRIASLHRFSHSLAAPDDDTGPALRFPG